MHQDFKRISEDQDMIRCQTGLNLKAKDVQNYHLPPQPLVPLGRQKTTCKTWLRMPIHDIDSPPRLKSRSLPETVFKCLKFLYMHQSIYDLNMLSLNYEYYLKDHSLLSIIPCTLPLMSKIVWCLTK